MVGNLLGDQFLLGMFSRISPSAHRHCFFSRLVSSRPGQDPKAGSWSGWAGGIPPVSLTYPARAHAVFPVAYVCWSLFEAYQILGFEGKPKGDPVLRVSVLGSRGPRLFWGLGHPGGLYAATRRERGRGVSRVVFQHKFREGQTGDDVLVSTPSICLCEKHAYLFGVEREASKERMRPTGPKETKPLTDHPFRTVKWGGAAAWGRFDCWKTSLAGSM